MMVLEDKHVALIDVIVVFTEWEVNSGPNQPLR